MSLSAANFRVGVGTRSQAGNKTNSEACGSDFKLKGKAGSCFVEVKSAKIVENGVARFPDSITLRGLKHLDALTRKAKEGHPAVLLFLIQRSDASVFSLSTRFPAYNSAFKIALAAGVEVFACVPWK